MNHEVPRPLPARRGLSLSYQGKTLLSTIDPIAQAERAARSYTLKERTLYIVASPLFGYGITALLEALPANSKIMCLEVDEHLYSVTKDEFFRTIPAEVPYVVVHTAEELCGYVRNLWGPRTFRRVELVTLNGGWTLYEDLYKALLSALQHDIAIDWSNAMTLSRMGRLYAKNALKNLSTWAKRPSIDELHFGQSPVLLAGAGPSLDLLLDQLIQEYPAVRNTTERQFRIICVDTALQSFLARSIPVDLVVALEAQIWNLKDFIGHGSVPFALAMDLSAHPSTIQFAEDRTYFFYTPWTELAFLDRLEQRRLLPHPIPPMGSVGLTATAIALSLTSGPVYIGGLDFAFTAELYHSKSSPSYQRLYLGQNRLCPLSSVTAGFKEGVYRVRGLHGQQVLTDRILQRYRDLFIRDFGGDTRLVDLRPSGLDLQMRTGSLQELIGNADIAGQAGTAGQDGSTGKTGITDRANTAGWACIAGWAGSAGQADIAGQAGTTDWANTAGRANTAGWAGSAVRANIASRTNTAGQSMNRDATAPSDAHTGKAGAIRALLAEELASLKRLRAILSGEAPAAAGEPDRLLDYCDYLWAHFPECAAAGRQRPGTDSLSFLKRVRAELDPFINLIELGLHNLE